MVGYRHLYEQIQLYEVACYAVGASIKAAKENGFALVRPPGHHATTKKAMGFCLFNNIAIASKYLTKKGKKVFILDIDSHSGNGSQEIFYNTNQVLFLSIHQFPAYPGTGWVDEIGTDKGKYYTINIPLPPYSGDDIFIDTLSKLVPMIKEKFKPDIVGVSAGFDGHKDDPLLQLNLSINAYYKVGRLLSKNFDNVFACLEGGYNLEFLHKNILSFVNGINKKNNEYREEEIKTEGAVKEEFNNRFKQLKENLKPYWKL